MEDFGARDWKALDFCRSKVGECDLFIGIVGHLHGSSPPDNPKSYTELEYEAALDYEKPILMFLASDQVEVPMNLIDQEFEKDPGKRKRQRAFQQRVATDRICGIFNSVEELSGLVRQAIHNLELRLTRTEDSEPNVGSLVPYTCDRTDQEADFRKYFSASIRQYQGAPQFYLIHGEERESHGSLVRRLCESRIQAHAHSRWGEQKGTVTLWDLDWPDHDDLSSRRDNLLAWLFEKIDPLSPVKENYDYSPNAFASHLSSSPNSVVVVQHEISGQTWDKTTIELIKWYLTFWGQVKGSASIPQCLIFLNLVYAHTNHGTIWNFGLALKRLFQKLKKRSIQKQIIKVCETNRLALSASDQTCPFVVLKELTCIKPDDVMRWFRRHKIGTDDGDREQHCKRIFAVNGRESACKNMRDVEHALNKLHHSIVKRRVET